MQSERLLLQPMDQEHVVAACYRGWLEDPRITQYLEVGIWPQRPADLYAYWDQTLQTQDLFLRVIVKDGMRWIGTVRLGPTAWVHRRAELGIMIGEISAWDKGYATEAVETICHQAWYRMGLCKVTAGVIDLNTAAQRVFAKAGFQEEARLKDHRWCRGMWCSEIRYARFFELCEQ